MTASSGTTSTASGAPDPRYPIGRFHFDGDTSPAARERAIAAIAACPAALRDAVHGFTDAQLGTPYRDGGWTVRQLVNHVADSHMNAYVRFKLALTEDRPTIKPYDEAAWAALPEGRTTDPATSLALLDALHHRWVALMRSMTDEEWERGYVHPEQGRFTPLAQVVALYAWHGRHHVAHVRALRDRAGWGGGDSSSGTGMGAIA